MNSNVIDGQELKQMALMHGNMSVLGNPGWNTWRFDSKLLSSHMLAMGSIGSGKTNWIYHLVKNIVDTITDNDVIIFFDSKGDFIKRFYRPNDYVIGNAVQYGEYPISYWNVYEEILHGSAYNREDMIREISTSLFQKKIDTSKDPTFASGARDIFATLIEAQLRSQQTPLNNAALKKMFRTLDITGIKELINNYSDLRWTNMYMHNENSATTQSFLSPLGSVVNDVFSSHFAENGDFSIRKAISQRGGRSIFLEYDIINNHLLDTVYTVLLDLASKEALGNTNENKHVYFILDEFPLIPKLSYIDNLLNFGRTRGVRVIAGIQNINQIISTYGDSLGTSILSGFSTYAAFHLFDEESRRFIAERHGTNRKLIQINYLDAMKNGEQTYERGNVIEDWDIVALKQGRCIISMPDEPPYLFYPTKYPEPSRRISFTNHSVPPIRIYNNG